LSKKNVPKSAQTLLNRPVFPRAHCEENGKNIGGFMPFCSKCGTQVPEGSQFCSSCGNKQGEQRGNSLGNFLGDAWNPGKTIIAIALVIAFIVVLNFSQTGFITIGSDLPGIISFLVFSAFFISLAIGIYAITRKQITGTKVGTLVVFCAIYLVIDFFFIGVMYLNSYLSILGLGGGFLLGYFSSIISAAAIIFGFFHSNKFLRNDENVNDVRGKLKELGL